MALEDSSRMSDSETSRALNITRRARRTQIVGQLTAGVYHDFNNILTVILAQAGMMELTLAPEEGSREQRSLDSIRGAAERGARLVRRLSDFRNRRAMGNKVCDLEGTLQSVVMMLDRLLGDDIEISLELCGLRSAVKADPALLEQAIVELMMNAREAMPGGGQISISTAKIDADGAPVAEIRILDQGPGPSQELLQNLGKAGFSTKEGHPGLGLFLVSSFIEESMGTFEVQRGTDQGTEACLFLPLCPDET
jgi:signal transduction histidine kinase